MDLNVRSAFFAAQAVAQRLIDAGRPGSIINMSSQMGHVGGADRSLSGLVRIGGSQAGSILHCRKFYTIDDTHSDGLARTAREALRKTLGSRQAKALFGEEGKRVSQEIEEVGAEEWCVDQREILRTDNLRVLVD
jgi:NAD(P)-dependent dehydrogenase (short-subunit alcohol dehydrogenase family)